MAFDFAAKIQGLLANADNESLPDEARATYRAKAEELMIKYRIAEEDAIARNIVGHEPIFAEIRVTSRTSTPHLSHWYQAVFASIARHTGIRVLFRWDGGYVAHVVGYEGDVRYAEFLWTAALLMFSTRIDPRWDDSLSEAENIWRLRNAGIERRIIADRAWGNGHVAAARSKVQRIYLRECAARNETPRATGLGHDTATYRQAYGEAFANTLHWRLRDARDAADSVRGGVELHGRSGRVDEAFYTRFPHMRPRPADDTTSEPCPRCAKAKSGRCNDHRAMVVTAAERRRWERIGASSGQLAGREAANGVTIARGHTRAARVDGGSGGALEG